MVTTYIIGAFIMMSIVMGILFLRLSHDDENEFILYWGIAWFFLFNRIDLFVICD